MSRLQMVLIEAVLPTGITTLIVWIARRKRRRAAQELRDKVAKAVSAITEDGIVEGPIGPLRPTQEIECGIGISNTERNRQSEETGLPWNALAMIRMQAC